MVPGRLPRQNDTADTAARAAKMDDHQWPGFLRVARWHLELMV